MSTHIVTKPLPMGEVTLNPGERVDASKWLRVRELEEQRFIRLIRPDERETDTEYDGYRYNGESPVKDSGRRMGRKGKDGNTRD